MHGQQHVKIRIFVTLSAWIYCLWKELSPVIHVAPITHRTRQTCLHVMTISCHVAKWDFLWAGISYSEMSLIRGWDETKPRVKNTVKEVYFSNIHQIKVPKSSLASQAASYSSWTTFFLCRCKCSSFTAVPAVEPDTPVCCASQTNHFLWDITSRAPISSSFFPR